MKSAFKFLFLTLFFIFEGHPAVFAQLDNLALKKPFYDQKSHLFQSFDQDTLYYATPSDTNNIDSLKPFPPIKPKKKFIDVYNSGLSFGNQFYCKNNEFGENNNPGKTLFGNQLWFGGKYYFNQQLSASLGYFLQYDFGDNNTPSFHLPIFNLEYNSQKSRIVIGSIQGNTNHNLIEPLYNYENTFTKPIEYGIQFFHFNKIFSYQSWLDWRQLAKVNNSQQEIISFGQTAIINLIDSSKFPLNISIPSSFLVYHQGGEALNIPQKIQTCFNGSSGFRISNKANRMRFETFWLFSNDVSPSLNHAFKNGHAYMSNLTFFGKQNFGENSISLQRIVATYYKAVELYTPLGAPLFASELIGKPYLNARKREFIMLRYQYERTLSFMKNESVILDLRVEPIYHIHDKLFAFSTGVYLKVQIGRNFIH